MTAEELSYELLHYPFSEESATELIKAYGKREIEKDRERVKDSMSFIEDRLIDEIFNDTPIELG